MDPLVGEFDAASGDEGVEVGGVDADVSADLDEGVRRSAMSRRTNRVLVPSRSDACSTVNKLMAVIPPETVPVRARYSQ